MKLVAKCSASISLSYQVHVKDCNPIPLNQLKHYDETMKRVMAKIPTL